MKLFLSLNSKFSLFESSPPNFAGATIGRNASFKHSIFIPIWNRHSLKSLSSLISTRESATVEITFLLSLSTFRDLIESLRLFSFSKSWSITCIFFDKSISTLISSINFFCWKQNLLFFFCLSYFEKPYLTLINSFSCVIKVIPKLDCLLLVDWSMILSVKPSFLPSSSFFCLFDLIPWSSTS